MFVESYKRSYAERRIIIDADAVDWHARKVIVIVKVFFLVFAVNDASVARHTLFTSCVSSNASTLMCSAAQQLVIAMFRLVAGATPDNWASSIVNYFSLIIDRFTIAFHL